MNVAAQSQVSRVSQGQKMSSMEPRCKAEMLAETSWEEARKYRYDCRVMTSLLREQVPVLDFVKWHIARIEPGLADTVLPLISPSTNQHCTHQAALLLLAADYTGGLAVASLLPGWPIAGVHPVAPLETAMVLWLVKGEIKFLRPSVGSLTISAQIETERHDRVKRRFAQGKTVLETVTVRFYNGPVEIAEANMTYYAKRSDALHTDGAAPDKINALYRHKLISSAELIAGVRARESGVLYDDPYSARIAGEHGMALAARFCEKTPQLGGMVAARTRHLDDQIEDFCRRGGRDIVLAGAGYDMRPFRLKLPHGTRFFEFDFPAVLADRQRRVDECSIKDAVGVERIQIAIDLRATTVSTALKGCIDFTVPIFVAWEGMSMYFDEAGVRNVLNGMAPLLGNPHSRLWADFVSEQAVVNPGVLPEVAAFMRGMQLLGEPFVFGTDSPRAFMESNNYTCVEIAPSSRFFADRSDPVYSVYSFCVASAAVAPALYNDSSQGERIPAPHIAPQYARR
jgi:methyltransferase (TIGR00027 family)